ncbi:uncharacterized protein LOC132394452 isoform X2 [Hypanus sabinus]|uniref:uncharacterized protein LOC132394452 isoform X2 n=1 Tax=Hypanus sabinus TaxID=79690 RepID=UPI0028C4FCB3|nr:uncharacterized protein LOC132394452 isoform X2 [Hypanus sabinus]
MQNMNHLQPPFAFCGQANSGSTKQGFLGSHASLLSEGTIHGEPYQPLARLRSSGISISWLWRRVDSRAFDACFGTEWQVSLQTLKSFLSLRPRENPVSSSFLHPSHESHKMLPDLWDQCRWSGEGLLISILMSAHRVLEELSQSSSIYGRKWTFNISGQDCKIRIKIKMTPDLLSSSSVFYVLLWISGICSISRICDHGPLTETQEGCGSYGKSAEEIYQDVAWFGDRGGTHQQE